MLLFLCPTFFTLAARFQRILYNDVLQVDDSRYSSISPGTFEAIVKILAVLAMPLRAEDTLEKKRFYHAFWIPHDVPLKMSRILVTYIEQAAIIIYELRPRVAFPFSKWWRRVPNSVVFQHLHTKPDGMPQCSQPSSRSLTGWRL